MEMSLEHMRATVSALTRSGFAVTETSQALRRGNEHLYDRTRFELARGRDEDLVLECLVYPDGRETYWLEIRRLLTMRAFNFQLDSWKHREDQVEFRFYARPDGVALTFFLSL